MKCKNDLLTYWLTIQFFLLISLFEVSTLQQVPAPWLWLWLTVEQKIRHYDSDSDNDNGDDDDDHDDDDDDDDDDDQMLWYSGDADTVLMRYFIKNKYWNLNSK